MKEIEYSTRPLTLLDLIHIQRSSKGDFESVLALITSRTNLKVDEAAELTIDEMQNVIEGIVKGNDAAIFLHSLSRKMGEDKMNSDRSKD